MDDNSKTCYSTFLSNWQTSLRLRNTGLVSNNLSLMSLETGVSLALVGQHSSDGVAEKTPNGDNILLQWAVLYLFFSYWVG